MFTTARSRRVRAFRSAALAVAAAAALTLSACSGGGSGGSTSGASSDTLTIAMTTPPISLDPTTAGNGIPLSWYMALAYEPLIERTPEGVAEPGLAEDWAYSEDRLSFVMNLREGVQFSDGSELTAEGVVEWLKHYQANGTFAAWLANVSAIEATGPLQVTLTLSTPDPLLPWGLAQGGNAGAVVSPEGMADLSKLGSETFGAGPYMLDKDDTIANSSYTFVKNPNYYNPDAQHYEKIIVKVITDQNSILSAMRSGQVQVAQGSATNAEAAESAGLTVTSAPQAMVGMYIADIDGTVTPAFKDVRVRQALNYALDREAITESVYGEFGTPTAQYVPEGIGGFLPELEEVYPYDPEKAKELLTEAGYPDGFTFTMLGQPAIDSGDLLAQAMIAQWAEIGVDVEFKNIPAFADYVDAYFSNQYPATTINFNYSVQLVDTQQLVTNPAVYNTFGYNDAKANELANVQRQFDTDTPEGIAAAEDSETYMVEGAFAVPVASVASVLFSDSSVTDLQFGPYIPDPTLWRPAN
ncbi:ABC transporter substrate-binding protein [Microbacterium sp. RD1]|uniref:ABC transporter substrate-binding protein n=1 Tax=Microbacterium sp. RD1 TaxID=3457313 RepID=UPI003FA5FBB6